MKPPLDENSQRKKDLHALLNGDPIYHGNEIGEDDTIKGDRVLSRGDQVHSEPVTLDLWQALRDQEDLAINKQLFKETAQSGIVPHTCPFCDKLCIDIRELVSESWTRLKWWAFENGPDISINAPTDTTIFEAIIAARQGCTFWSTLLRGNDYVFEEHHGVVYFSKYLEPLASVDQHCIDQELGELYGDDDGKIMLSYIASRGAQPSITFKLGRGPGQITNFHIWIHPSKYNFDLTKIPEFVADDAHVR